MNWNYRAIKKYCEEEKEYVYGIHEVYFDKDGAYKGATEKPVRMQGESIDSLKWMQERIAEALEKPVLEWDDFKR